MKSSEVRTIVGILGNVISCFLFLSPVPTFVNIWRAKSVQAFKPDVYIATILNCAVWVLYGLPFVHPDSVLVITINAIGLVIESTYLIIFFIYSDMPKRRKIVIALIIELIFVAAIAVITMLCLHTTKNRSMLVGILCIILNVVMYVSPLTVMKRVIKTKSVKYMPFYLSLANLLNGIVWTIYAFLKFDPFILVPNGLGTISGLVQLVLYGIYYKTTKWDDDRSSTQSSVELQP
ncbi:bidirectional sugar transporter SWEET5 [Andrographis paniculata]|uniref:bidirectional sugar transporter SWEET5 n=1 Tax=Andrographis paniculata TaxID=175694 RepID=UPI0021E90B0A|nr:bidirectional sugar transporter SWEET5 [Andrographis paniculata]